MTTRGSLEDFLENARELADEAERLVHGSAGEKAAWQIHYAALYIAQVHGLQELDALEMMGYEEQ